MGCHAFRSKNVEVDGYVAIDPNSGPNYEFGKKLEEYENCGTNHYKLKSAWRCAKKKQDNGKQAVPRPVKDGEIISFTDDEKHMLQILEKLRRDSSLSYKECMERVEDD